MRPVLIGFLLFLLLLPGNAHRGLAQSNDVDINAFFQSTAADAETARGALDAIAGTWRDGYAVMLVELTQYVPEAARQRLFGFLETQTGQTFGDDINAWRRWTWTLPYDPHPLYGAFKGALYSRLDPRMAAFFPRYLLTTIRLDEVLWGGIRVNGIPPLDHPARIDTADADYLDDDDIVFGIALNGEAMAYPKRILAWHEMALDRIGGVDLTIIYCTLCGTVLPYESTSGGELRKFGTSGLLYRSNKLFFDEGTRSLWSTLVGQPVIGPLAGREDLKLTLRSSVTTTWGEWRRLHPGTEVLSLDTGYDRDYGEGVAYQDYFATDELMFPVSLTDNRIANKDEVLVMHIEGAGESGEAERWAIATDFLDRNRIFRFEAVGRSFVVITSPDGANRVYESGSVSFDVRADSGRVVDRTGVEWQLTEDALLATDGSERFLERVTANRAFWFGWYAQFPDTGLIH